ncbi:MAG TPA: hypothetical protein VN836_12105 [Verrucomicrobiae bacterium]|nr:hypothetical protein [Verrucomicrobiae bacterium]
MTNAERMKLIAAEARREKEEARALDAKIELAVSRNRLSGLVADQNRRRKNEVQAAVKKLTADDAGQLDLAAQFIGDADLIPLALQGRIHRARAAQLSQA